MAKSSNIHPYPSDDHRRVSRGILMWFPLVVELGLIAVGIFALSLPRTEKWLIVVGLVVISIGLAGTTVALLKRPKLALEPEQPQGTMVEESAPRQEHMKVDNGMVIVSSTTAPMQAYGWFLVSFLGLMLILAGCWPVL